MGGPRASAEISAEERRSIENAIWLCPRCASLIDKDEQTYTVEELRRWKAEAEAEAKTRLQRVSAQPLSTLQLPQAYPPSPDIVHPHTLREAFTGRAQQRLNLTRWWKTDGPSLRMLVGIGGLGKSSLAWVWMWKDVLGVDVIGRKPRSKRKKDCGLRVPDRPDGVLWWSFYAPELQIDKSFDLFIDRALRYTSGGRVEPESIPSLNDRIDLLLERLRHGRFLIVLDGVERATRLYDHLTAPNEADSLEIGAGDEVRRCSDPIAGRFLRGVAAGGRSRLLLTSRVALADLDDVANVECQYLAGLEPEESLALFEAFGICGTDQQILAACSAVGHHPLAVRLMIGYANAPGLYRGDVRALPDLSQVLTRADRLRHVFEMTYDSLDAGDRTFLGRVAVYTQAISYEVLRNCSRYETARELKRGIERLEQRGLLSYDPKHRTYDMHPVVRQYAYEKMATAERKQAARATHAFLADRLRIHETNLATLGLTLDVYRQALRGGLVASATKIFIHRLYPVLYFRLGQYHSLVSVLEELIAAAKEHPEQVSEGELGGLMVRLSTACNLTGFPRDGYRWAMEAASLRTPDPSGASEANGLVYIASSAVRIGKLRLAVDSLEKSVAINLRNGARFAETIARLNLGLALTWSARFEEATTQLDAADRMVDDTVKRIHWRCVLLVHRTRLALLMGDGDRALRYATAAHELATEGKDETDLIRSRWAMGASMVRQVEENPSLAAEHLPKAEGYLRSALAMCSENHYGEFAMEVHIAMAHWHAAQGDTALAAAAARAARELACRGGHALKEAEADEVLIALGHAGPTRESAAPGSLLSADLAQGEWLAVWGGTDLPCVRTCHIVE